MAIVTISDLQEVIAQASWFTNLGLFPAQPGYLPVKDLNAWKSDPADNLMDTQGIAADMEWLPTTHGQEDPIHRNALQRKADQLGRYKAFKQTRLNINKTTLISLRSMNEHQVLFKVGPDNYAIAAKGAALYAARQAAGEIVVDMQDFWCSLIPLYAKGHWPKGLGSVDI
jgi:hypothetical protein